MKLLKTMSSLLVVVVMLITSCAKPETPPNNVNDRGHELPDVTTYSLIPGALSKENALGNDGTKKPYLADGFVPEHGATTQLIKFYYDKSGNLKGEGKWIAKPDVWYRITVDFVNKAGANINYQYISDEHARALHQFFYRTFLWDAGQTDVNKMIDVQYGDNNPVQFRYGDKFSNGKLIDPPIGFVGYIRIDGAKAEKLQIQKFVLNAILVHSMARSKLNPRTSAPFPFDHPGDEIIGVTDIDHRFEVDIQQ